jgi:endonuclease III
MVTDREGRPQMVSNEPTDGMAEGRTAEPTRPSTTALRRRAHRVAELLHDTYGSPRHGNKDDPLDELIFILLSQMTTGPSFNRVFDRVKAAYPSWDPLLDMPLDELRALIKDAGLSGQKAPRIQTIFRKLKQDFGAVTLAPLAEMTDAAAEGYLTTLPGIGTKTAKCILMYSLGRQVLPVDTHVWRVTRRLGLIHEITPYPKVHDELEAVIAPADRYSIHVNGLAHGQAVCIALRPRCEACPLRRLCPYPARVTGQT